jgi:hypothetical protein
MEMDGVTPIEQWAMQSKARAVGFLLGLAVLVSAGLTGVTTLLAAVASQGLLPAAVASTH